MASDHPASTTQASSRLGHPFLPLSTPDPGKSLSANGRFVAFKSGVANLVAGDTNDREDVFVHDRQTGKTTRVNLGPNGRQANSGSDSGAPAFSADGRYVAFTSYASNLVRGDTNGTSDIFVHDRQLGKTTRVSVGLKNRQSNAESNYPSISADGRFVAFGSYATNLVSGDTNDRQDIFVHDRQTGKTKRVSVGTDGAQGNDISRIPSISAERALHRLSIKSLLVERRYQLVLRRLCA